MKKVLIFDFDGVIVDTADLYANSYISICKKNNIHFVKCTQDYIDLLDNNFFESISTQGIDKNTWIQIQNEWKKNTKKYIKKQPIFKGIKSLLKNINDKSTLYIVTSNYKEIVIDFLEHNKLSFFKEILGGDEETSKTKKITTLKKQFPDSKIFFITDTIGDIKEGKAAGVKTIATTWGYHNKEKLAKENPDHIFDTVEELKEFLLSIFK